jgi:MFS transporter, DHA2 family, multidrug resistance protein
VPREKIGYAASLYNMLRNTGAAIGIAFMTNSLVSHQQLHQAHLVEHFSIFDAWRFSNTMHPGAMRGFAYIPEMTHGSSHGLALLYGMVHQQAMMMAFNDIYRMLAIGLIPLIPLFLLLPSSKTSPGTAAAH